MSSIPFLRAMPFLFLLSGFACSTPSKTTEKNNTTSIVDKYWKLVELSGQPVIQNASPGREPHVYLHMENRRVSGSGGCNNFSGTYEMSEPQRIRFSPLAATRMACLDNTASETETRFFQVLEQADSYYVRGDSLQLFRARMAPLARFVAVVQR